LTASVTNSEDARHVVDLLATAFADDPILAWVLPGGRNTLDARRRLFAQAVRTFLRDGLVEMTDDRLSAAVWASPHAARRSRLSRAINRTRGAIATLLAAGTAATRSTRLYEMMHAHHPREKHWYLVAIGTHPDGRGRGGASKLLAHRLEVCDREGLEAYLESSNPNNLPLYERHGFEIVRTVSLGDSPPLWLMTRPPHRPRFD